MTLKQRKSYMEYIKGMNWDKWEDTMRLVEDPVKFKETFKRYQSRRVCNLLFKNHSEAPLCVTSDPWLRVTAEWLLKNTLINPL